MSPNQKHTPRGRSPWIINPQPHLELPRPSGLASITIGSVVVVFCFYKYFDITHPEISQSDLQRQVFILWTLLVAFHFVKILGTILLLEKLPPKTNSAARLTVALLGGVSSMGVITLFVGAQTTAGNLAPTNYFKMTTYLLLFIVFEFFRPVNVKPANDYRWDDRFSLHRQNLDLILNQILGNPEYVARIKKYLSENQKYLALLDLIQNTPASLDQARSLLPRIAAHNPNDAQPAE